MAKLMEKNGAEICACLVNISAPLKRFIDDAEFSQAWKRCTKKGLKTGMTDVLKIYAELAPLIFGDKHLPDTLAILAEIEGTTVKEMLAMNGADLLADAMQAFSEQLRPFLLRLGVSVGEKL